MEETTKLLKLRLNMIQYDSNYEKKEQKGTNVGNFKIELGARYDSRSVHCRLYDIYTIGNMQNVLMTINTISQ